MGCFIVVLVFFAAVSYGYYEPPLARLDFPPMELRPYPTYYYQQYPHYAAQEDLMEPQHTFFDGKSLPLSVAPTVKPTTPSPPVLPNQQHAVKPRNDTETVRALLELLGISANPTHAEDRSAEEQEQRARLPMYYELPPLSTAAEVPAPASVSAPAVPASPILSLLVSAVRGLLQGGPGTAMASAALARLPTVLIQGLLTKITTTISRGGLKGLIAKILIPLIVLIGVDILIFVLAWWLWDDSCDNTQAISYNVPTGAPHYY